MFKRIHKADYIAFNVELVKAVEKHPCLYNYNVKEYCNREFVQETWEKLGKQFSCSARECKETWKNLRIVFSRNIKKQNTGIGLAKKPYYLLESMSYLIPFMKSDSSLPKQPQPISGPVYYENTSDEQTSNRDDEEDDINYLNEQDTNNLNHELTIKEECDSGDERIFEDIQMTEPPRKKQKNQLNAANHPLEILMQSPSSRSQRKQLVGTSVTANGLCDYSKSNTFNNTTSRENSKHQFLLSLFPDVDDMNDSQFRSFRLEVCKLVSNIFTFQPPPPSLPLSRTSS